MPQTRSAQNVMQRIDDRRSQRFFLGMHLLQAHAKGKQKQTNKQIYYKLSVTLHEYLHNVSISFLY